MGVGVIGVIALLVGLGIGYATWGSPAQAVRDDLAKAKTMVEQATAKEGQTATKIQDAEAKVKQVAADLEKEKEMRAKLEALAAKTPKKK
jgi:uncharacterized protein YlxW (UPF0749 family)